MHQQKQKQFQAKALLGHSMKRKFGEANMLRKAGSNLTKSLLNLLSNLFF